MIDASDLQPIPDDGINMKPHGDPPDNIFTITNSKNGPDRINISGEGKEIEIAVCANGQSARMNFNKDWIPSLLQFLHKQHLELFKVGTKVLFTHWENEFEPVKSIGTIFNVDDEYDEIVSFDIEDEDGKKFYSIYENDVELAPEE